MKKEKKNKIEKKDLKNIIKQWIQTINSCKVTHLMKQIDRWLYLNDGKKLKKKTLSEAYTCIKRDINLLPQKKQQIKYDMKL